MTSIPLLGFEFIDHKFNDCIIIDLLSILNRYITERKYDINKNCNGYENATLADNKFYRKSKECHQLIWH